MNPYLLLAAGIAWAITLIAVGSWQREDGRRAERVSWQAKYNADLKTAKDQLNAAQTAAREAERESSLRLADIDSKFTKEIHDAEARRRRDVAAARDGALVLRVPASVCGPDSGTFSQAGSGSSFGTGTSTVELPRKITGDLFELANDADQVADQLRACQDVVLADRGIYGPRTPQ